MFVVSMKASKKKLVIILAAILIVLAGALFFLLRGDSDEAKAVGQTGEYSLTAADASQRVAFCSNLAGRSRKRQWSRWMSCCPHPLTIPMKNIIKFKKSRDWTF